jgi:hypothetical protein
MKRFLLPLSLGALLVSASAVQASGDHGHDDGHADSHGSDSHGSKGHGDAGHHDASSKKGGMFLKKKDIDGYSVSFHIMKAKLGKEMGGTHDFMIKVEKNGRAVNNVAINTKVVHPNGKSESKKVMKMGGWHMAGYDLAHEGKHQMMVLFKTKDGKKHMGGVYY